MAQLIFDLSGKEGLAPRHWGDYDRTVPVPNLRYIGTESQMADGVYNPLKRYGYLSPANNTFTTVQVNTSTPTVNLTSSIYDPVNSDFYFAEAGQKLWRGDTLDDLDLTEVLDLGSTGTPEIMDLEFYQVNQVRKMFVLYEKSGNMDIAISSLPYNSAADDPTWLTVTVSGSFTNAITNRPFMRTADNGFAYIFQDNFVHKIDGTSTGGTNGTVTANVLVFPNYFQLTDAIDTKGNLYICIKQDSLSNITESEVNYESLVGVYIWDRNTTVLNMADYIPLYGVKQIKKIYITKAGQLRVMVITSDRITEIRQFNGSTFVTIQEIGYLSYPAYHDSITNHSAGTLWIGADGFIYLHGYAGVGEKESLFKIAKYSSNIGSLIPGAILYGGANGFSGYAGFKTSRQALYLYYVDQSTKTFKTIDLMGTGVIEASSSQAQGDVYTLVKYLPQMSTLKNAEIYCYPITAGSDADAATIKFYANQSTTAFSTKTLRRDSLERGYIDIELNKPYVNSLQIEIEFSTSTSVGAFDFSPSIAIVNYESTNTIGK